jgi:hypothetical protein
MAKETLLIKGCKESCPQIDCPRRYDGHDGGIQTKESQNSRRFNVFKFPKVGGKLPMDKKSKQYL